MNRFITFEGGEGAGKSTQVDLLRRSLASVGVVAMQTREPGGSPIAESIRQRLIGGAYKVAGPEAEAIMFAAARVDHMQAVILPALERGWVICDRFCDSTRVYQGVAGAGDAFLRILQRVAVPRMPDLTILLDIDPEIGLQRAAGRGGPADRFESEVLDVHKWRRTRFLALAAVETARFVTFDATADIGTVADRIFGVVHEKFLGPDAK